MHRKNNKLKIISIHTRHDANLSISIDGKIKLILELERIFKKRYFDSSSNEDKFKKEWQKTLDIAFQYTKKSEFDVAITNWVKDSQIKILKKLIKATRWITCDHHLAHATLGWQDSGFNNPLILSFDGGGNDGVFNFYHIKNNEIDLIERKHLNLGAAFRILATFMPEITHGKPQPKRGHISLSGKIMGYSALGNVHEEWVQPLVEYYYHYYRDPAQAIYSLSNHIIVDLKKGTTLDSTTARDLAASSQKALEFIVRNEITEKLKHNNYNGIVLSGGVALNVINNTLIKETFKLPVHVPSAPNDCGISIGSIFAKFPHLKMENITYKGLPIIENSNEKIIQKGKTFDLSEIANLLVKKNAIIGVARSRAEVGPRALGNRSILCYPDVFEKKARINSKIKFREWYRPFAPVIKEDRCKLFFGKNIYSPYMSFAYQFTKTLQGKFPAVEHVDKTARLQTVSKLQNAWIYNLLDEIEKLTGFSILLNTSFNTKGYPLVSDSAEAFEILKNTELTHIIVNDRLYCKDDIK